MKEGKNGVKAEGEEYKGNLATRNEVLVLQKSGFILTVICLTFKKYSLLIQREII